MKEKAKNLNFLTMLGKGLNNMIEKNRSSVAIK